jgi:hypothetical protein
MKKNIDFQHIVHLPVDDGFPIQSAPLTVEDIKLIQEFIKKSKATQRRRELYAKRKLTKTPEKHRELSALSI